MFGFGTKHQPPGPEEQARIARDNERWARSMQARMTRQDALREPPAPHPHGWITVTRPKGDRIPHWHPEGRVTFQYDTDTGSLRVMVLDVLLDDGIVGVYARGGWDAVIEHPAEEVPA